MNEVKISVEKNYIKVCVPDSINLAVTLDCGQAFRWKMGDDGIFYGIVRGVGIGVEETADGLIFYGITKEEFYNIFYDYFDLGRDYSAVLSSFSSDPLLMEAVGEYGVIRILNQEPWETLCSFIISSCNNIPRIKKIIDTLCLNFGEKCNGGYSFPSARRIAELDISELGVLRAGYRDEFIMSAARAVASGEIDLEKIKNADIASARKELMKIKGVGAKVADCTLLFGLGFIDAFPIDRHIKRIESQMYPDGLPECTAGYRGIAQQYMFHYQRMKSGN